MELTGLASIDQVRADLSLPEPLARQFLDYFAHQTTVTQSPEPTYELILPDGHLYGEKGKLGACPGSGTILILSIIFPNPNHVLQPGELVKVRSAAP
jgi:hypothetical protein